MGRFVLDAAKPRHAQKKWVAVFALFALALLSLAALRVGARPQEGKRPPDQTPQVGGGVPSPPPAAPDILRPGSVTVPGAPAPKELAGITWGPGREVQAGLAMTNRYGRDDQHTGLYIFSVYLRNRTRQTLTITCPSFGGLIVPSDNVDYLTMFQSKSIFCTPHLRDGSGRAVDVKYKLGTEESRYAVGPGQVVCISRWMLRTMGRHAKETRGAKDYLLVAFVAPGRHRMTCDVSAAWGERPRTTLRMGEVAFDVTGEDLNGVSRRYDGN